MAADSGWTPLFGWWQDQPESAAAAPLYIFEEVRRNVTMGRHERMDEYEEQRTTPTHVDPLAMPLELEHRHIDHNHEDEWKMRGCQ